MLDTAGVNRAPTPPTCEPGRSERFDHDHPEPGTHRAALLGCHAVLVLGGLGVGLLARGALGQLGTGTADTPDVGLVLAALPLLALAVCFVVYGLRLDRALGEAPMWRWAAAVLLVCALAPFDQLGPYGLVINVAHGSAAAAAICAAHADLRIG